MTFIDSLLAAPLPNLLIVIGAFFVLLAVVSKITTSTPLGTLDADGKGRTVAAIIGPILIVMGLLVIPAVTPAATPSLPDQELSGLEVAPLTPESRDGTPPERATGVDQSLADTTPNQPAPLTPNAGERLSEVEPNDDAFDADVVEPGDSISGEVFSTYSADPSFDSDYFAVWVDTGDPLTVDVTRAGGAGTLYVAVLDPNGFSEPSGTWLSDIAPVGSDGSVRVDTVASQTGYHYVLVSGWIYLTDLDLYYNDGGNGGYTVTVGPGDRASLSPGAVDDATDTVLVRETVRADERTLIQNS
ncbi:PPC domain-containing protein [Salinigranum sp.]|uniref:PPC domain-containing protein n=1 Tax=Salinigranum sp. TaxID=1966351 RepID=UPI003567CD55